MFLKQQGIRFAVEIDEPSRGYILEVFDNHFVIPSLGPIGILNLIIFFKVRNLKIIFL